MQVFPGLMVAAPLLGDGLLLALPGFALLALQRHTARLFFALGALLAQLAQGLGIALGFAAGQFHLVGVGLAPSLLFALGLRVLA